MKKLLILFILASFFGFAFHAQAQTEDNPNAPVLKFEVETHDFGTLDEGPKTSYDFIFTNTGKEPLILTNVKAACGCTTPYWSKEPILPGQSGKITAEYSTQGRPGPFNKPITITSNATKSEIRIFIKGNVVKSDVKDAVPEKAPSIIMQNHQHNHDH